MEQAILYEYMVANGKFVKYTHIAKTDGTVYKFKKNNNLRMEYSSKFNIAKSGRVISLEDDEEMAKKLLVAYLENHIAEAERSLKIARENLKAVQDAL